MTDHRTKDRANAHIIAPMVMATFCLAACEAFVGSGPVAPFKTDTSLAEADGGVATTPQGSKNAGAGGGNAKANTPAQAGAGGGGAVANKPTTNNPTNTPTTSPTNNPTSACDAAPAGAKAVVTTYCSMCHSDPSTAKAGFSTILNVPALLSSGKIVADQPAMSLVYKRISEGSMPPAEVLKRPGDSDIAAIKTWINCGATDWDAATPALAFTDIDSRLHTVLEDVRSFPNPVDRQRMRYFDISSLANAGNSGDQVEVYRQATSMLMNSLSHGQAVVAPVAIDKDKLLYRIDLRDYLWDAASWTQLEAIYPYAVVYDQNSRLFPFDETASEEIRQETNTQIPVIQADWFISHASRPPLYFSLLKLANTLDGLGQQLGVNIQQDIDTEQVLRAGFANAGPSQNNRVIERHELGGNRGALWLSYDFSDNLGVHDVFAHPLDFQQAGGEMIFNLENGLQGYFIANFAGTRLDKAPNNVVQDPASRDGAVEAGLSCMNCHQTDGQLPKYDEIRAFELMAGASAQEIEQVLALYATQDVLQPAFDSDQNRYRTGRAALNITAVTNTTMHQLDDTHLGIIDLNTVAAVVGLPSDDLKRAIDASPQAFPPEIVTLRTQGGGIQRDSFESVMGDLITALGLGQQLVVDANGDVQGGNNNNNNNGNAAGSAASSGGAGGAGGSAARPNSNNNGGSGH
jgi:cytochrome c553